MGKSRKRSLAQKKAKVNAKLKQKRQSKKRSAEPEMYIIQRKRRRGQEAKESRVPLTTTGNKQGPTIIGPNYMVVNLGLGKIKLEEDYYIPPEEPKIKIEPVDVTYQADGDEVTYDLIKKPNSLEMKNIADETEPEILRFVVSYSDMTYLHLCPLESTKSSNEATERDNENRIELEARTEDLAPSPELTENPSLSLELTENPAIYSEVACDPAVASSPEVCDPAPSPDVANDPAPSPDMTVEQVVKVGKEDGFGTNAEMLKLVLSYVDLRSLYSCRKVNYCWNKTATNGIIARNKPATLTNLVELYGFYLYCLDAETIPFNRFKLNLINELFEERKLDYFLAIYSSIMKHLEVNVLGEYYLRGWNEYTRPEDFVFSCMERLKMFINLKELETMHIVAENSGVISTPRPEFTDKNLSDRTLNAGHTSKLRSLWMDECLVGARNFLGSLMKLIPNLQALRLTSSSSPWNSPIYKNASIWPDLKDVQLSALHISDNYFLPAATFWSKLDTQRLLELSFCLVVQSEEDKSAYEQFLETQSENLCRLSLSSSSFTNYDMRIHLPRMTALEHLEFTTDRYSLEPIQTQEIENVFQISFPLGSKNRQCYIAGQAVFPRVKKVRKPWSLTLNSDISSMMVRQVGRWFPNLKRLDNFKLHLPSRDLKLVFRNLSSLEEMELIVSQTEYGQNVNYALSGLPDESAWLVNALFQRQETDVLKATPAPYPSLASMTRLRNLDLTLESSVPIQIDQIGVQLGFLRIQPLRKLSIHGNFQLSSEDSEKLKEYHSIVELDPDEAQTQA